MHVMLHMYAVLVLLLYIGPMAYIGESILLKSSESQNLFMGQFSLSLAIGIT